ncbi:MAG: dihydroneopterin aldolase [Rhodospirillaceae bacterium]|nr:dihydroneopterin aldolase [Rhodospirillaceae bacterium]MCY4310445.1 dihydroneopterin aldolase [Rhodospirillaceae bacterium]
MTRLQDAAVSRLASGTPAPRLADVAQGFRHIFVRDLVLTCSIGVYRHERDAPQRVRLNLDLVIQDDQAGITDHIDDTVSYEDIVDRAQEIVAARHYNLVETLAESLAGMCLDDDRVIVVNVRVEKLDVFPYVGSVGVEIERSQKIREK